MKFRLVKTKITIITLSFYGLMLLFPISAFLNNIIEYGVIFLILWIFAFGGMLEQCLIKHIVINTAGVKYKTLFKNYHMSWDEIKIIGIGYIPIKAPGRKPWIYFAAGGIPCPMLNPRMINSKFFMVSYREEIMSVIKEHWRDNINRLNEI